MATKILMVCLGNICRSPLAEGILQSKSSRHRFIVDSAGTAAYHIGKAPDARSIQVARNYGIDISKQKARQFTVNDFDRFDHIFAMDNSNYENIIKLSRSITDHSKVKLILNESEPQKNKNVPDPYYGGDEGFEKVYHLLDEACNFIAERYS